MTFAHEANDKLATAVEMQKRQQEAAQESRKAEEAPAEEGIETRDSDTEE